MNTPTQFPLPGKPDPSTSYYVTIPTHRLLEILRELEEAKEPCVAFGRPEDMLRAAYELRGLAINSAVRQLNEYIHPAPQITLCEP